MAGTNDSAGGGDTAAAAAPAPPTAADPQQQHSQPQQPQQQRKRKKRRWGDAPEASTSSAPPAAAAAAPQPPPQQAAASNGTSPRKRSRFSSTAPSTAPSPAAGAGAGAGAGAAANDPKAKAARLQQSIQARLAALKARQSQSQSSKRPAAAAVAAPSSSSAPAAPAAAPAAASATTTASTATSTQQKRAKVFELDLSVTGPSFREKRAAGEEDEAKKKKKINPYLAHREVPAAAESKDDAASLAAAAGSATGGDATELATGGAGGVELAKAAADRAAEEEVVLLDGRLAGGRSSKPRPLHRPVTFVEPGSYVKLGEEKRRRAAEAAAAGYVSGRKEGRVVHAVGMATVEGGVAEGGGGGGGWYGAGEAGLGATALAGELPSRADAPLDDTAGSAAGGGSAMPTAMEWWDAELLPGKLKKEVAKMEQKALSGRAMKERLGAFGVGAASAAKVAKDQDQKGGAPEKEAKADGTATETKQDEGGGDENDENNNLAAQLQFVHKCYAAASLSHSKTSKLIQHPPPVTLPGVSTTPSTAKATLHMTKQEMKRQRKLRRAERQREQQDLQAAGLVPPPEPRLTLSNFMKVLGDQAVLDPSQMERKVAEQIQARKLKHEKMNEERKLTKEQRKAKRERKLMEDTSKTGVHVALFYVADMSHRYHRTKVDLNAQQNKITGGVLECSRPSLALVVAEGGPKAIQRYIRLMTVRMKWKGENFRGLDDDDESDDEEEDEADGGGDNNNGGGEDGGEGNERKSKPQKFNAANRCDLIWTGMTPKRAFATFAFQSAPTSDVARKVLEAKGVANYWDRALVHVSGTQGGADDDGDDFLFRLKLGGMSYGGDDEEKGEEDGDVVMGEESRKKRH